MTRKHMLKVGLVLLILTLLGCATSSASGPTLPSTDTLPPLGQTAIDGLWQIQGNQQVKTFFRIKNGVMWADSNTHPKSSIKPGWLVAKDIRLNRFPKFSASPISLI